MSYRVKELRQKKLMSQEELCEKAGISRATLSGIENGTERNTSTKTLAKLAQALETTVVELFFTESV